MFRVLGFVTALICGYAVLDESHRESLHGWLDGTSEVLRDALPTSAGALLPDSLAEFPVNVNEQEPERPPALAPTQLDSEASVEHVVSQSLEPRSYKVWPAFSSRTSAQGFASLLADKTGLQFRVEGKPDGYHVLYDYQQPDQLVTLKTQLAALAL